MVSRLSDIRRKANWRENFYWPIKYPDLREKIKLWCDNYAEYCYQNKDTNKFDLLSLVSVLIIPETTKLIWLSTIANDFDEMYDELVNLKPTNFDKLAKVEHVRLALLRRKFQEFRFNFSSINKKRKFEKTRRLLISHNSLLRNSAKETNGIFSFYHASTLLLEQRLNYHAKNHEPDRQIEELTRDLAFLFLESLQYLPAEIIQITLDKMKEFTHNYLYLAQKDIVAISKLELPFDEIWMGTAGYYPTRLIALHSKKNGIKTKSFDHGGSTFMVKYPSNRYLLDMSIVDQLVLPNHKAVENFKQINDDYFYKKLNIAEVIAGFGDPYYAAVKNWRQRPSSAPIQALYCLTLLGGFKQNQPTLLPDLVAVDLQFRVISWLKECGITPKIKPHPGTNLDGLLKHPLGTEAEILTEPFESVAKNAEIFIFDYAQSTTFWAALCTNRPVILIDTKITEFDHKTRELLAGRCYIIETEFDDRGRCIFAESQLTDALLRAREKTNFDSQEFISLLS